MRYEEETILMDTNMLKMYSEDINNEMNSVEQECWQIVGFPFNLSSPKEKSQVFDRLGISTGERNKRGEP
jgi:DNA polymerase I-like protein with 3'-5' exonuclease and polymerase domains